MGASELPELLRFVSQEERKLLVEIFNEIGVGLGVMENQYLLDRMINEIEYCRIRNSGSFSLRKQPAISVFSFSVIIPLFNNGGRGLTHVSSVLLNC
jgi:hypothetical protein